MESTEYVRVAQAVEAVWTPWSIKVMEPVGVSSDLVGFAVAFVTHAHTALVGSGGRPGTSVELPRERFEQVGHSVLHRALELAGTLLDPQFGFRPRESTRVFGLVAQRLLALFGIAPRLPGEQTLLTRHAPRTLLVGLMVRDKGTHRLQRDAESPAERHPVKPDPTRCEEVIERE